MNLNDDKDTIIESQCNLIEKLRANLVRYEGVISNLEAENKELKKSNITLSDGIAAQCELENDKNNILRHFVKT